MTKQGFSSNWRSDIISGFVVFLIALPLSLGIALASGFPASAGIMGAIIGGIIGTFFTGTHIAVSGPAAGLIVVVLHAVQTLGHGDPFVGYQRALACICLAGICQVIFGYLRAGSLAFLCPASVVHGMLAAIGVIIMVKQYPVLLGATPHAQSIIGLMEEIPQNVAHLNLPVALIGFACFFLLIGWNRVPKIYSRWVPGPLLSVVLGIAIGAVITLASPHHISLIHHVYNVGPNFLVNIPGNLANIITFPDFSQIMTMNSIVATFSIFIVASLESLLSAYAIDKLDSEQRHSDLSKDLMGKGIVNICCGLIGALPVISEIVRSSANAANGARSRWSNFFHGVFLLLFFILFPSLLHKIPLSALAAILIIVGFRLAHPKQLKEIWHHGKDQLAIFLCTMVLTLVEDLLVGIAAGTLLAFILHIVRGVRMSHLFNTNFDMVEKEHDIYLRGKSPLVFSNFLALQKYIRKLTPQKTVHLDLRDVELIDFTFREHLTDLHNLVDAGRKFTVQMPHSTEKSH